MTAKRADPPPRGPARRVFVDETGASTAMTRPRGRGRRGRRVVCPVPPSHWTTTTSVAARRADGLTAPMVIDGAMTGDHFVAHVRPVRVPARRPGDVVVGDSLGGRRRAEARAAVEAAGGEVRFLPPYSPDRNPPELAVRKRKGLLRAAEERTGGGLWTFLGRSLDALAPAECGNDFRHAGYAATPNCNLL